MGIVSGKLKYFNTRYMYGHKSFAVAASFGISISKGASAGITFSAETLYTSYPSKKGGIVIFFLKGGYEQKNEEIVMDCMCVLFKCYIVCDYPFIIR